MKCLEAQRLIRPYLEKQLTDEQLSQFLEHVDHCRDCREELELNMAIYQALESRPKKHDEDPDEYNYEKKLRDELHSSHRYLRIRHTSSIVRKVTILIAEMVILATIFTGVELHTMDEGGQTTLYRLMHGGSSGTDSERSSVETESKVPRTAMTEVHQEGQRAENE